MIVIIAAALALAGLPTASVLVLIAEILSLGVRLLVRLRGTSADQTQASEA
ncbi:hypothetical protein ACPCVL_28480 [Streptomyces koyangensis]|uniref:hypothetical protein n=1 Tax=Streptomyces koyangensis TaxID=188770 RepID=UPI003C2B8F7A